MQERFVDIFDSIAVFDTSSVRLMNSHYNVKMCIFENTS